MLFFGCNVTSLYSATFFWSIFEKSVMSRQKKVTEYTNEMSWTNNREKQYV